MMFDNIQCSASGSSPLQHLSHSQHSGTSAVLWGFHRAWSHETQHAGWHRFNTGSWMNENSMSLSPQHFQLPSGSCLKRYHENYHSIPEICRYIKWCVIDNTYKYPLKCKTAFTRFIIRLNLFVRNQKIYAVYVIHSPISPCLSEHYYTLHTEVPVHMSPGVL